MGIDYESKLIFGIEIDYKTYKKINSLLTKEEEGENFEEEYDTNDYDEIGEIFTKKNNLYLIFASSYYDSPTDENRIFISMIKDSDEPTLQELINISKQNMENYTNCLKKYEIEFEEPKIISTPHIW